jgi:guanine deaminase
MAADEQRSRTREMPMTEDHETFMARAIALSEQTSLIESAGGAFGCVIVQDGRIIAEGANRVVAENDPTWHAEMAAIRKACTSQGTFKLRDATLYTSAEPCPMCMAACYWAGIKAVYYASQVEDALEYGGFDDSMIYGEIKKPAAERTLPIRQMMRAEAVGVWRKYAQKADRGPY